MSDWLCVLRDNADYYRDAICLPQPASTETVDDLVLLSNKGPWNDTANRTMLLYRAWVAGCQWAVWLDDDMLPSKALFRQLRSLIPQCCVSFVVVPLRELWGDMTQYRCDGIWGEKTWAILQWNWLGLPAFTLPHPSTRLHKRIYPDGLQPMKKLLGDPFCVYHFGSMTKKAREARVAKYKQEDPKNEFQGTGYDYMLDETELRTQLTPAEDVEFMRSWIDRGEIVK